MRTLAWLAASALLTVTLAGCAGGPAPAGDAETYEVKVLGSHALRTLDRTITVELHQGGQLVGSGSFTVKKGTPETPVLAFAKTLPAGPVTARAFDGANPVGTKTLDPAKCPRPLEFEMHVVDDAVHTYSNCD
jgi:hypothetical protein